MDYDKISEVIKYLRLQKNMTQKQLAERLSITEQAISKWERGVGMPDISTCVLLAEVLGVNVDVILSGNLEENQEVTNNMKNLNYYICPICGNVTVSAGEVNVSCCGRAIVKIEPQKAAAEEKMTTEEVEDEIYITCNHPMRKDDYISFTAFASGERIEIVKHYPEWSLERRISKRSHGMFIWYSKKDGLKYQLL